MDDLYKPFGLISILLAWTVLGLLVYVWRGDKSLSFSKQAATHQNAYWMMAVAESIFLPMFLLFTLKWFVPAFNLPDFYNALIVTCVSVYLIAAWIPDNGGRNGIIHGVAAYSGALLLIPMTAFIAASDYVGAVPKLMAYVTLAYMILSISLYFTKPKIASHYVYLQAIYLASFHLTILSATYIT